MPTITGSPSNATFGTVQVTAPAKTTANSDQEVARAAGAVGASVVNPPRFGFVGTLTQPSPQPGGLQGAGMYTGPISV